MAGIGPSLELHSLSIAPALAGGDLVEVLEP